MPLTQDLILFFCCGINELPIVYNDWVQHVAETPNFYTRNVEATANFYTHRRGLINAYTDGKIQDPFDQLLILDISQGPHNPLFLFMEVLDFE